jgi:hypothetical protein
MVGRAVEPAGARTIGTFADGSPAATVNEYGQGAAAYLAGTASVAYADGWRNWAQPGLSRLVGSLIAQHTDLEPVALLEYDGREALDVSVMKDDSGGAVITLTLLSEQGKKPAPVEDVRLRLSGLWPDTFRAFEPAAAEQGPVAVSAQTSPDGTVLSIPLVTSALVIVAADQSAPPAD